MSRSRSRPRRRRSGAIMTPSSSGRCWPSASSVTTMSAPILQRDLVADAEREAAAAADRQLGHERPGLPRHRGRPVLGAVGDDDRHDVVALHHLRHRLDHGARRSRPRCRRARPSPAADRRGATPPGPSRTAPAPAPRRAAGSLRSFVSADDCSRRYSANRITTATTRTKISRVRASASDWLFGGWKLNVRNTGLKNDGRDRERDDDDAQRARDDQVQPADVPSAVPQDLRRRRTTVRPGRRGS